jgi:hypothetical protein
MMPYFSYPGKYGERVSSSNCIRASALAYEVRACLPTRLYDIDVLNDEVRNFFGTNTWRHDQAEHQ